LDLKLTGINGIKEVCPLGLLLDVCVDQEGVGLRVDVLHHDLETVEASRLGDLYFTAEALDQVLVDNSVRGCEECEDMGDEVALVIVQLVVPVVKILGEINFLCRPEGCLGLLVHLPNLLRDMLAARNTLRVARRGRDTNLVVLDWEQNEAVRVLLEKRLV
jgi:hypothetical protein